MNSKTCSIKPITSDTLFSSVGILCGLLIHFLIVNTKKSLKMRQSHLLQCLHPLKIVKSIAGSSNTLGIVTWWQSSKQNTAFTCSWETDQRWIHSRWHNVYCISNKCGKNYIHKTIRSQAVWLQEDKRVFWKHLNWLNMLIKFIKEVGMTPGSCNSRQRIRKWHTWHVHNPYSKPMTTAGTGNTNKQHTWHLTNLFSEPMLEFLSIWIPPFNKKVSK